ncbi:LytTR family DNA-binding domain-containing protein [Exiguobacterium sp. s193]|uniref:LytR/AlgR family response regulator transcription factor n=1 Tax=Exiguobacterium sp. s193 TaxID=2751207 RepID=UPI001BEBDE75|nr:LytTR family DNA-binding domain-containing protein [Exiguobacterium sp. s193]
MRTILIEDEPLARDELRYHVTRAGLEVIAESASIVEAEQLIRSLQPDIVFLDIELADGSGLDLAKRLQSMPRPPAILFVTAYDVHALEAFELNAYDYILKPYDPVRITRALEKIIRQPLKKSPRIERLAVESGEQLKLLSPDAIDYIVAEGGKTNIVTRQQTYQSSDTLQELERKLVEHRFLRVHRSYLVNLSAIDAIEPWFNGAYNIKIHTIDVPVSRTYVKVLKEALGI